MFVEDMVHLGKVRSEIREIFEYGNKRKQEIGAENVFDFSIGNPSVPAPESVKKAIIDIVENGDPVATHGYTSAQGDAHVRDTIANYINKKFGTDITKDNIYMTCGAAASLTIVLNAIMEKDEECIVFTPFFPEYTIFIKESGAKVVQVPGEEGTFQIDMEKFEAAVNEKTKAVIVNSPNNPSGVVYSEETIVKLCDILRKKEKEYGHPIFLITDEPYRELVYDGAQEDFLTKYYHNTIVGYSFSKSLSLPGERIGYVVVPDEVTDAQTMLAGIEVANRTLGFVNAPSLMQKAVACCVHEKTDLAFYDKNRKVLYEGLTKLGFTCVKPQGAFYLWMRSPIANEEKFVKTAKKYNLILVKGSAFGCGGYVRLAYCISNEKVVRSLDAFAKLAKEYGLG